MPFVIMGRTIETRKKMKDRPKKFVKGIDPDVKECLKLSDRGFAIMWIFPEIV